MTKERASKFLLTLLGTQELVDRWWITPNKAFDFKTPQEQLEIDSLVLANHILDQFVY